MTSLQKASLTEIRNAAARICRDYLTGEWKSVRADELIVKRISGGLSNFLYYVALPESDIENKNLTVESTNELHSTAINIENDNFDEISDISDGHIVGNGNKRQRTDSEGSIERFSSFSAKRLSYNEPSQVLLRIYGQSHGEDALEAMITESVVFALLSERNFGPKLHGIFPGGRIEQYIPARALVTQELSDERISGKIAEKMGEIHSLNIPMSKEPDWIWNCMNRWLDSVDTILKSENLRKKYENSQTIFNFDFDAEVNFIKTIIEDGKFPVLFCHNDLQEGNILFMEQEKPQGNMKLRDSVFSITDSDIVAHLDESSQMSAESMKRKRTQQMGNTSNNNDNGSHNDNGNNSSYQLENEIDNTRDSALSVNSFSCATADEDCEQDKEPNLMIIDFEYCAYNYRGFDLANHFLEWTLDYTNPEFPYYHHHKQQYPTEKQRRLFMIAYLRKLNSTSSDYEPANEEIELLQKEVRVFSMLSHLFWSLWSIVNVTSNIEFGYWEYAVTRIQEYKKLKHAYLNQEVTNSTVHNN